MIKATKRPPILHTSVAALLALVVAGSTPSRASVLTWNGTLGPLWETPFNWDLPPGVPTALTPQTDPTASDLVFTDTPPNPNNVNDGLGAVLNSISWTPTASNFSSSGLGVLIQGGGFITNNSSNLQVLSFINDPFFGGSGIQLTRFNFDTFTLIPVITWTAARGDILITTNVSFASPLTLVIDGPRNITVTSSIFDVAGGEGTLLKKGTGTLLLTGNSTFPGDTTINGGRVLVDGSIASVNTIVNPGGTLGGKGFVGGAVWNSGNVSPGGTLAGDSIGTLTVKSYNQSKAGTLTIEIAGKRSGQFDKLLVQGHATLDGTLRLLKVGKGPRLCVGEKVTFLTADGGISGKFSKVVNPFVTGTIVKSEIVYHSNSVALEGKQGSFGEFAKDANLTVNQRAVAGALDKVAFRNNPGKLIRFLDCEMLEKLPAYFDQIAPEELASIFNIGMALANVQGINLQRRTADIRAGANGFSAAGLAMQGSGPRYAGTIQFRTGAAGPTGNEGKESKSVYVPVADNRWGVFVTGVGEWVDVSGDGNARGYDITTGGFTLGIDYKITPNLAIGLSAGYAGTGADLNNNGRILVNGGKLGLYGTYFDGGFYADAAVTGGYNGYDTRRRALQGTARGSTDGGELNVLVGTGYDWKIGALSIGPTGTYQYTYLGFDGFRERGSLAPLNVASQDAESKRTALGMKASYDWKLGGVLIKPELRAAWQHEYGDTNYTVVSSFSNSTGNPFSVNGNSIGRDSLLVGAGFAILWNERTSTYVYYDGELLRTRYDSHSVSGGIRVAF